MSALSKLLTWVVALAVVSVVTASGNNIPEMVPRTLTSADGTISTILVNRKLQYTRGSEGTRPVRLTKRFPFSAGRDEWCGEVAQDPATNYSPSAPSAADCKAIVRSLDNENGFWTLQPGDFGSDGWAHIVSSGTCSFAVRHTDPGSAGNQVIIGTNDVRFYTNRYAVLEKDGKLGLQAMVQCYNDQRMLSIIWGLVHS
ncbi:uncharacterized protein CTRU02_202904 [Colletotrichum truncatum]|uniref:Uncharacterized protein n=1 Tax=Colletotrichum truncatum TaxID=5467 RepID=A0ACC3ZLL0_COLTU|nr:uncharacterized protein CTRU02_13000 [Colletotrichum truncatum]KAF6783984.1 hypothetical protein CTRU02_13000 [Colletotrichum truncatum]